METAYFIFGGLISIIAFFMRYFFAEINKTKSCVLDLKTKVAVLENNHTHLSDGIEKTNALIEKMNLKIDHLTEIMNKK